MANLAITLTDEELLELQGVLMDEDEKEALEFLKTRIAPKLPVPGKAPCDSTRKNPYLFKPG
jgi:hypothetical protein